MIAGFDTGRQGGLAYAAGGEGPPLVLLHGFPQTHAMWAHIAPILALTHRVICPDLPGYGDSDTPGLEGASFRAMGQAVLGLLDHLGVERFALVGHDRGGRVAHRLCLDAPDRVDRVALMDIVPTHTLLSELQHDVATAYYHWFFLAQPEPFPDTMIAADPDAYFESCLGGWGGDGLSAFDPAQLDAYRAAWRQPERIRGMCDDYRAGVTRDFEDDCADLGARIRCPALILYGEQGVMARFYDVAETWAPKCTYMEAQGIPGGHFFPDTAPEVTAAALAAFLEERGASDSEEA
ncbi:alpha/beta fold hydrolase [Pseudaestuariivita atlantica]|uniref:Alpha/beta hydrolase n=1 Tax=Pseudaestuariivita atlantica TaxID=1317121 RepID=A0A0L1JUB9_9RHOB|nr:alpha/beta hydrolase [Pseudaestuariivita atlantica]KNG95287.1 alpha/beta hydrolase [Pseudaestuariivita atlantica]